MSPFNEGTSDQMRATVPATCGEAMDVPSKLAYALLGTLLRTPTPGAAMFGLISPANRDGPRLEKLAMLLLMSKAPAEYVLMKSPGDPDDWHDGPLLPLENAGQ